MQFAETYMYFLNHPLSMALVFLAFMDSLSLGDDTQAKIIQTTSKFLALGDSYTIGEAVPESQRWPMHLVQKLNEQGIDLGTPEIIAKTGWTTDELSSAIASAKPHPNRELVTLLIGVNNQYRGRSLAQYRRQFEQLLSQAVEFAQRNPKRVIVVAIPDYGITPFIAGKPERDPKEIAEQLDAFNAAAEEITLQTGAHWVDITKVYRRECNNPGMLAEDGLHPSGSMYSIWADAILPTALKALQNSEMPH